MRAADFYQHFEGGFNAQGLPLGLKKMADKTLRWRVPIERDVLQFKVSTDFKGAGLLDPLLWPGEHRMHVHWIRGRGQEREERYVSLFQYTTELETAAFTEINRGALRKYLDAGGADPHGTLRETLMGELAVPKPSIDTFYFYFDADDARNWGEWYGAILGSWIGRFTQNPESNEDWAWRVLWPDAERPKRRV